MYRFYNNYLLLTAYCLLLTVSSFSQFALPIKLQDKTADELKVGAQQIEKYFPLIKGKNIAVVAHPASLVNKTHLVDTLLKSGMKVKRIFAPEHGFRGNEGAGEKINNQIDEKTGLPVISLYGKKTKTMNGLLEGIKAQNPFKPEPEDLKDVDVVLFDLQDVGARFYTYLSTLHYVMESCAENKKQLIILDRPNPNGYYVDGPILEPKFKSFSGMHPVPIVYGMTIGEYAKMINGEKWLANGVQCNLTVIPVENYSHSDLYQLPVKPSPNLPNMSSVYLYPSLCLFEGTMVSVGRGTDKPFQIFGYPGMKGAKTSFIPKPIPGVSENPMYNGQTCNAFYESDYGEMYVKYYKKIYLFWILSTYKTCETKDKFFNNYFNSLAGNETLQKQIKAGKTEEEIRNSWEPGLKKFKEIRKKYLLYPDFE
jgi:uncharacterized protein YbbC (DUF1343 family)